MASVSFQKGWLVTGSIFLVLLSLYVYFSPPITGVSEGDTVCLIGNYDTKLYLQNEFGVIHDFDRRPVEVISSNSKLLGFIEVEYQRVVDGNSFDSTGWIKKEHFRSC